MEKKTLMIIGFIGGMLTTVGVFLPWASASTFGKTVRVSGWDVISTSVSGNLDVLLVLIGGILALVGGLVLALAIKIGKNIDYLIPLGGILAIIGWIFFYVPDFWYHVKHFYLFYGYYMCLVGGILALIGGIKGIRAEE